MSTLPCGVIPGWTLLGTHVRSGTHGRLELAFRNADASQLPCVIKRFTARAPAEQEREALLRLNHGRIVKLLDDGCDSEGVPYLVFPYYPLGHLTAMSLARFSIARIARMIEEILSAVDHAHDQGVLHGDLAACNVLLTDDQHVILIDFAGCKIREELNPASGPGASAGSADAGLALQVAKQRSEWPYWVWSDRHQLRSLCRWLIHQGQLDDEGSQERSLRRELSACLAPRVNGRGLDDSIDPIARLKQLVQMPAQDSW